MASPANKGNPSEAGPVTPEKGEMSKIMGVAGDDSHADKRAVRNLVGPESTHLAGTNFRRTNVAVKLFGVSLLVTLGASVALFYWAGAKIEKSVAEGLSRWSGAASPPSVSGGNSEAALTEERRQISALQQQLDNWRRDQLLAQKELRESIERVSASAALASKQPAQAAPVNILDGAGASGVEKVAEMVPQITPTQKEFIQLKERNRITAYADEAIATAARKPLETIVEYLRDSGSAHLHDAAQTEYMRVVRMVQFYQREDPSYRLPVSVLFKDNKEADLRTEADLSSEHLHQLLAEHGKHPWEVRVRAAMLLKSSTHPQTDACLLEALKGDPSLEVAKHAQITFEQRIQRRFRLFDLPAIESWLQSQQKGVSKVETPLK